MVAEVRAHWKNYLLQSALAALTLLIALLVLKLQHGLMSAEGVVIVASMGSTAFIVFVMPRAWSAHARNVVGGHLFGLVCGTLGSLAAVPMGSYAIVAYSVVVGLSIFLMVVTDTEHPPAAGTALGVAISGVSWKVALAVVTGAVVLALAHRVLGRRLRDLT